MAIGITTTELNASIAELMQQLERNKGVLAGSLYLSKTRCGRKNCKCMQSDYRHENQCLSFSQAGKSKTRTVPDDAIDEIRKQIAAYRELKAQRRQVLMQTKRLLQSIDTQIGKDARKGAKDVGALLVRAKEKGRANHA